MPRPIMTRRTFLRGTGVALALPLLDAMDPDRGARAGVADAPGAGPRRMVAICTALGLHGPFFFPGQTGRDYTPSPYLELFGTLRSDLTVFSGLSHPGVNRDHVTEASYLTAAPHPENSHFKNTISLDQFAAQRIGDRTRFPYLALNAGESSLSWTRSGVRIPADSLPSRVFARLFLDGSPDALQDQVRRLRDGRSILDNVADHARALERAVGPGDREKLDEYFTSVREVERRLARGQEWAKTPKPRVDVPPPRDIKNPADFVGRAQLMYDMIHLALQTDSTRIITLMLGATNAVPPIAGVSSGWHNLSHHGQEPENIEQLALIEKAELKLLVDMLARLKATSEAGTNLLDRTMVLFGSNLGNASSHDAKNLPILLAGGGFKHGQYLAHDRDRNRPLSNLFVAMLQRLDIETDAFGSSTGTISGLEPR